MKFQKKSTKKNFGIISHPDAGKTTLTENYCYLDIHPHAIAVKNNKIKKSATSDFMEIEKQRGLCSYFSNGI